MTAEANGLPGTETTATDAPATNTGGNEAWWSGLAGDNRSLAEKKNWKTADDAMTSFRELESMVGKSIRPLPENASAEEEAAFYTKLGRPEKPEGYEFKLDPTTVPENFPYDEKSVGEFRNWAHEAGVNPKQAQKLHDKFVAHQASMFKEAETQRAREEESAHRVIVSKWGEPETEQYKQNLTLVGRAASELGWKDSLVKGGLISSDGAIRDPAIADGLLKVAKELYSEGSANSPGTSPTTEQSSVAERMYGATTPPSRG